MENAGHRHLIGQIGGGLSFGLLGVANVLQYNPIATVAFFSLSLLTATAIVSEPVSEWMSQNRVTYVVIVAIVGIIGFLDWVVW